MWMYLIAINVLAFSIYGIDKQRARRKKWRISEKTLIGLAVFGGSVGAWLAMRFFHHKTKHLKFSLGIPLILVLQLLAAVVWRMGLFGA